MECGSKILVTGTPVQNNISELLNLVAFLNSNSDNKLLKRYKHLNFLIEKAIVDNSLNSGIRSAIGSKCMDEIKEFLNQTMLRRSFSQIYKECSRLFKVKVDDIVFMAMDLLHF
mmetsp:Transcript_58481/g.127040  ORF Transcript_58481/g.127040 Transcript_58481/m.127040 type:complete len:114 (+) Transcript_58481:177-518(+)